MFYNEPPPPQLSQVLEGMVYSFFVNFDNNTVMMLVARGGSNIASFLMLKFVVSQRFDFRGLLIECFEKAIRDATILKW